MAVAFLAGMARPGKVGWVLEQLALVEDALPMAGAGMR